MTRTDKIKRMSALMSTICSLGLIFFPLLVIWVWVDFDRINGSLEYLGDEFRPDTIALPNRILGFIFSMIPIALLMRGLWHLRSLFELFRKEQFLSQTKAKRLRSFAIMLLFSALAAPVVRALVSVAVTFNNVPGQRAVVANIDSQDFNTLFVAMVFLTVAWVMRETHPASVENAGR
jgi:amino acid transporter